MSAVFSSPFSLPGEVALITGGGTGLGLAIAKCFAEAGAEVVITGRREAVLDDAVRDIGKTATAIPWDVNRPNTLDGLVAEVESSVGPIGVLVNNAGVHLKKPATETLIVDGGASIGF